MNDFTKEELEMINDYIKEINRRYECTAEMEALTLKVQAMVDSYLEVST